MTTRTIDQGLGTNDHSSQEGRALARDGFTTMVYILLGLAALTQAALLIWTALL